MRADAKPLSKQDAAKALGYTQTSWDNTSGNEEQPATATKQWSELTQTQKSAAIVLGYTEQTWITISQAKTSWSALIVSTGKHVSFVLIRIVNEMLKPCTASVF